MDRKLKWWETALLLAVLCSMAGGFWLRAEQRQLAQQVVRLHIVANSDSPEDQHRKLAVRDRVLEMAGQLCPPDADREAMVQVLEENLQQLNRAGQEVLEQQQCRHPVTASLERCWFPTKQYDGFALPAGEYLALRVVIGEGRGENWWCVAFPPLCLPAAGQTLEQAVQAGSFTREQAALVSEAEGYVLKFRSMELLGEFLHRLGLEG